MGQLRQSSDRAQKPHQSHWPLSSGQLYSFPFIKLLRGRSKGRVSGFENKISKALSVPFKRISFIIFNFQSQTCLLDEEEFMKMIHVQMLTTTTTLDFESYSPHKWKQLWEPDSHVEMQCQSHAALQAYNTKVIHWPFNFQKWLTRNFSL